MKYSIILLVFIIMATIGCAAKTVQMTPTEQKQIQAIQKGEDTIKDRETKSSISEEELAARDKTKDWSNINKESLAKAIFKDIYFEFDSYTINPRYFSDLNSLGNWLKQNISTTITIEGHCDERGTIEYNLALGQKRSEAVKNYLAKLGIDVSRIKTISFGKEVPLDSGHEEDAWAKNRRASFKID